jgi:hypothetical protein
MALDSITLALAKKYTDKKVEEAALGGGVDLSDYAKKGEIPTQDSIASIANEEITKVLNNLPIAEQSEF